MPDHIVRDYTPTFSRVPAEFTAMAFVGGAFHFAGLPFTAVERMIYAVRVQDAMREGVGDAAEIAWRALELEGWCPAWVTEGEASYIQLKHSAPPPQTDVA